MIELTQHQRVAVLVLGSTSHDMERLQSAIAHPTAQWQMIAERDLSCFLANASRFECVLVYVDSDTGLTTIESIRNHNGSVPIIAIGRNWQVPAVVQAMKLGATEVCEFPENAPELQNAFQRCLSVDRRNQSRYSDVIPKALLAKLTTEEARILHLLVEGRTTKEVGATLDVSIRTVHYRKKELLRKLGVQNRSEAIELIRVSFGNYLAFDSGFTAL